MENSIQLFKYNGHDVEFDLSNNNIMVNATEMAKIFGKKVSEFVSNTSTKLFVKECLKSGNSRFLEIEKETDLIVSKQKSGTWMHRILALKFAAWLSPSFEVWVYQTIDNLLFGELKNSTLKQRCLRRTRISELEASLRTHSAEFQELEILKSQEKHAITKTGKEINRKISAYQPVLFPSKN